MKSLLILLVLCGSLVLHGIRPTSGEEGIGDEARFAIAAIFKDKRSAEAVQFRPKKPSAFISVKSEFFETAKPQFFKTLKPQFFETEKSRFFASEKSPTDNK